MRVTPQVRANHRGAMLRAAGRLFRAGGIDRVSVADVTREAGLTHGAFYGHFPSKEALAAEATRVALEEAAQRWRARAAEARAQGADPLALIIGRYLSPGHRDALESSCALVALGSEAARAPEEFRAALAAGTECLLAVLREEITTAVPDHPDPAGAAHATLATMSGGLALARIFAADPARSDAVLASAAAAAHRTALGS